MLAKKRNHCNFSLRQLCFISYKEESKVKTRTIGQVRLMVLQRDENMAREILAKNLSSGSIED